MKDTLTVFSIDEVVSFFEFLDDLRANGKANVLGAGRYLVEEFGLSKEKSKEIILLWMDSFDEKIDVGRRARTAYVANGGTL